MADSQFNTSALIPSPGSSPLMQPIDYQGQTYFASQYFHRQYLANSQNAGKHRQHAHFVRLLKSIEAYQDHIGIGDIVELSWKSSNDVLIPNRDQWQPLFQATGYRPLTLLNATAQAALSHHLDDELSKQMSVAINTQAARQMTRQPGVQLPEETAVRKLEAFLQLGRLLNTPMHIVQQEAAKQIEYSTGVNLRPLLNAAPAQDAIASEEEMLEPTELAKRFNMISGYAVNIALERLGWQAKHIGGGWDATPTGLPFASRHAWTAEHGTKSGYNWKWKIEAVRAAFFPGQERRRG